jgi:HSP20 family protein
MLLTNRAFDLFDEMFDDGFFRHPFQNNTTQVMKTDVQENDKNYLVDIELPGYAKEDVQAELKDGYLTITALKHEDKDTKDQNGRYIRRERYSGTCKRSFYVGEDVKQEEIQAAFKDGILRLQVPKVSPETAGNQPKLIEIQ